MMQDFIVSNDARTLCMRAGKGPDFRRCSSGFRFQWWGWGHGSGQEPLAGMSGPGGCWFDGRTGSHAALSGSGSAEALVCN